MSGDKSSKDKSGHPAKSAADPFQAEYDSALKLSKEVGDHERLALTYMQAVPPASKKTNVNDYTKKQAAVTNEINAAIKTADASQAVANRVMSDFNKTREGTREALAKHFGFDPAKFSEQDIENKLRSGNLDRHQREKLEELAELQKEWLTLKELRETPGITRTQAAYIKASGKLDALPSMPIQQQVIVDGRNADEAFSLLRQAAQLDAGGNLVKSQSFAAVTDAVNNRYGRYQLDLCLQIQGTLDLGDKLMKDPSKMARGEQQYQIASDLSSKVNLNFIAAHQEELGTHGNQKGPLDLRDAYALLEGSVSRQAQTLISHGQNQKALPLLVKLMANVPELFDKPAFQAELLTAEIGAGSIKHDPSTHIAKFADLFFKTPPKNESDDDKHDRLTKAIIELNAAEKGYKDRSAQLARSIETLKVEQQNLETEKKNLTARTEMEKAEKDFALFRINNELNATKNQIKLMTVGIDTDRLNIADLAYWQGSCYVQRGDSEEANDLFKFAKNNGSRYANDKKYKLDDLIDNTSWWGIHKGYFKQALIVVAGVAAGIAVGILTSETGPGAIFAGATTTTRVILALSAGSVATAATTKLLGEPVTVGTFIRGAGYGLGGLSFIYTTSAFAPAVTESASEAELATAEAQALEARVAEQGISAETRTSLQEMAQLARNQASQLKGVAFRTRVLAGAKSGFAYSLPVSTGDLIASTEVDHLPAGKAWQNFAMNVGTGTVFGTFTPLSSYKMLMAKPVLSGESLLVKAWSTVPAVGAGWKAGYPVLLGPPLEGSAVNAVLDDVARAHHKKYDLSFRQPQPRDFSDDTYIELEDPTVRPSKTSHHSPHR